MCLQEVIKGIVTVIKDVLRGDKLKIKIRDRNIRVFQLVNSFELDWILVGEDDSLIFVIDIFKNTENGEFFPKVYHRELFSISPSTFTEEQSRIFCDEEIIVRDDMCDWESITGDNPDDVLQKVLKEISDKFNE